MKIIDHGTWETYKPPKPYKNFEGAIGTNVLYARRVGDNKDWFDYAYDEAPFEDDSVKMIVHKQNGHWVVGAAVFDVSMLWPDTALVLEIKDYRGANPQADFGGKIFDRKSNAFSDRPKEEPAPDVIGMLHTIIKRLDKLEAK